MHRHCNSDFQPQTRLGKNGWPSRVDEGIANELRGLRFCLGRGWRVCRLVVAGSFRKPFSTCRYASSASPISGSWRLNSRNWSGGGPGFPAKIIQIRLPARSSRPGKLIEFGPPPRDCPASICSRTCRMTFVSMSGLWIEAASKPHWCRTEVTRGTSMGRWLAGTAVCLTLDVVFAGAVLAPKVTAKTFFRGTLILPNDLAFKHHRAGGHGQHGAASSGRRFAYFQLISPKTERNKSDGLARQTGKCSLAFMQRDSNPPEGAVQMIHWGLAGRAVKLSAATDPVSKAYERPCPISPRHRSAAPVPCRSRAA